MDRYFFRIEYGEVTEDVIGIDLPNVAAASASAVQLASEILKDEGDGFWTKPDLTVTVTDAGNLTLWTLSITGRAAPSVAATRRMAG